MTTCTKAQERSSVGSRLLLLLLPVRKKPLMLHVALQFVLTSRAMTYAARILLVAVELLCVRAARLVQSFGPCVGMKQVRVQE